MDLETLATLSIPALFVAFIGLERLAPARPLPKISWWKPKGVGFFVLTVGLSAVAPLLWLDFVQAHRLLDLESLGIVGGAALAFVVTQFFAYWWHRAMHNTPVLWRWFHQMHHSAERLDVFGATYFHPFDVVGFAFLQSVVPFFVLGVAPEAALIAGVIGMFYSLFQHANVRTPRWLGYLIQRPESHSIHHGRGVHAYNYGDFPLWDLVFGTFRNPARFEAEAGFWDGASKRVGAMLLGRDVAEPPRAAKPAAPTTRAAA
jgi:sterol desaturase/sphingolipid hydroxylase (fatty acid hydroxylase superfamily)